jgi:hypothetical protein
LNKSWLRHGRGIGPIRRDMFRPGWPEAGRHRATRFSVRACGGGESDTSVLDTLRD